MEFLYIDKILLINKNIRAMNILLHAVEIESEYYGLKLNQTKCVAIITNRYTELNSLMDPQSHMRSKSLIWVASSTDKWIAERKLKAEFLLPW